MLLIPQLYMQELNSKKFLRLPDPLRGYPACSSLPALSHQLEWIYRFGGQNIGKKHHFMDFLPVFYIYRMIIFNHR